MWVIYSARAQFALTFVICTYFCHLHLLLSFALTFVICTYFCHLHLLLSFALTFVISTSGRNLSLSFRPAGEIFLCHFDQREKSFFVISTSGRNLSLSFRPAGEIFVISTSGRNLCHFDQREKSISVPRFLPLVEMTEKFIGARYALHSCSKIDSAFP